MVFLENIFRGVGGERGFRDNRHRVCAAYNRPLLQHAFARDNKRHAHNNAEILRDHSGNTARVPAHRRDKIEFYRHKDLRQDFGILHLPRIRPVFLRRNLRILRSRRSRAGRIRAALAKAPHNSRRGIPRQIKQALSTGANCSAPT